MPVSLFKAGQIPKNPGTSVHPSRHPEPRPDLYGDLLPQRALARMGTERLRHGGPVGAVAFAPDRKSVASGGRDNAVRVWDPATGKPSRRLSASRGPGSENCWVLSLAYSADGKDLAASLGNSREGIVIWELPGYHEVHQLGHQGDTEGLAFMPDSKRLVSAGSEGTVECPTYSRFAHAGLVLWYGSAAPAHYRSSDGSDIEKSV